MAQQRSFFVVTKKISIAAVLVVLAILAASLFIIRDDMLDNLLIQHHLATPQSTIRAPRPLEEVPSDRSYPVPKSQWDSSKRYLTYLPFGGISNQFYSLQNAMAIAKRLNRTLVIPPIMSNSLHDRSTSHQPWSHFMDLDYAQEQVGLEMVEWHQIKHLDPQSVELVDRGSRLAIPDGWRALAERFPCQVVRGYGQDYWINPKDEAVGANFAYRYLLSLEAIPVPGTDRYEVTDLVDDIVQGNQPSNETVICLSFTLTAQFARGRNRWDISWNLAGRHLRFLPRFAAYVEDLIAFRFAEWERYRPLNETQVLGKDPALLESPSETLKDFLESTGATQKEGESKEGVLGGSMGEKKHNYVREDRDKIEAHKSPVHASSSSSPLSAQGSVAKGPIIRHGFRKDRGVASATGARAAARPTVLTAPIVSAQNQEPAHTHVKVVQTIERGGGVRNRDRSALGSTVEAAAAATRGREQRKKRQQFSQASASSSSSSFSSSSSISYKRQDPRDQPQKQQQQQQQQEQERQEQLPPPSSPSSTLEEEQHQHQHPQAPRDLGTSPLDHGPDSTRILDEKAAPRDYIAIHLRRGDIDAKCAKQAVSDCIIPLSEYKKHVDKIIADHAAAAAAASTSNDTSTGTGTNTTASFLPPDVVLLSDTSDEAEKQEVDRYGWYRLDYTTDTNLVEAWEVLGPFAPAFIDSAVLAGRSARWVIGSRRSTMSWLAAMRLASWHNRTIIYPALPPDLAKLQQQQQQQQQQKQKQKQKQEQQKGAGASAEKTGKRDDPVALAAEATETEMKVGAWKRKWGTGWMDDDDGGDDDEDEIVVLDRQEKAYFDHFYLTHY
ncbi:hypothetical protein DFQ26_001067 [Actinomortierella ambigua]|nr:hypothetical protein DFQ26_001067 [Actinomortierella ambigua]